MRHRHLSLLLVVFSVGGCNDSSGTSETSLSETSEASTSAADSNTTGDECSPGLEGCPCHEGDLCIVGLICLSDLCVEPPSMMTSSTTGGEPTGGDEAGEATTTDTADPFICESNYECADDEVCFEGSCGAAVFYDYEITVTSFAPPSCRDGVGTAEVLYKSYIGNAVEHISAESACPSSWPNETFRVGGTEIFSLEFWEADGFADDYFTSLCWQEFGECSGIPDYVLHDYGFVGLTGDGIYSFSFSAYPVEWCGNLGCE